MRHLPKPGSQRQPPVFNASPQSSTRGIKLQRVAVTSMRRVEVLPSTTSACWFKRKFPLFLFHFRAVLLLPRTSFLLFLSFSHPKSHSILTQFLLKFPQKFSQVHNQHKGSIFVRVRSRFFAFSGQQNAQQGTFRGASSSFSCVFFTLQTQYMHSTLHLLAFVKIWDILVLIWS